MNPNFVPAVQDALMQMETAITKTATYVGTTFALPGGGATAGNYHPGGCGQPIGVVVQITAVDVTTGDETYTFTVQESPDGNTWTTITTGVVAGHNGYGVGLFTVPAIVSQPYLRLTMTAAGTTPSITYNAWANPNICP